MSDIVEEYRKALDRIKKGKPLRVLPGTKITNDSVSLEAGRKKGTIKKSRPIFADLIAEIQAAIEVEASPQEIQKDSYLEPRTKLRSIEYYGKKR